jgi:hypothetical protein
VGKEEKFGYQQTPLLSQFLKEVIKTQDCANFAAW